MLLLLGQLAQAIGHRAAPRRARRAPTSASTRSGATGNAPGSSTPSLRMCSQTRAQALGRARRLRASSAAIPRARKRLEHLPADSRRLGAGERRRRPALRLLREAAAGGEQRARSARTSALISSCRSADSPLVEQARRRVPLAGAQLELAEVAAAAARTRPPRRARPRARGSASAIARALVDAGRARASRRAATGSGESVMWGAASEAARKRSQTSSIGRPRRARAQASPCSASRSTSRPALRAAGSASSAHASASADPLHARDGVSPPSSPARTRAAPGRSPLSASARSR